MKVRLDDFPQLKLIAWNRHAEDELEEAEAFTLYETRWRFIDQDTLTERERELIRRLTMTFGAGLLNV
jgi:hypothetical protein